MYIYIYIYTHMYTHIYMISPVIMKLRSSDLQVWSTFGSYVRSCLEQRWARRRVGFHASATLRPRFGHGDHRLMWRNHRFQWENYGTSHVQWKITMQFMGNPTISMLIFQFANCDIENWRKNSVQRNTVAVGKVLPTHWNIGFQKKNKT